MKSAQGREREKIGFVLIAGFLLIFGHAHAQVSVNGVSTELSPVAAATLLLVSAHSQIAAETIFVTRRTPSEGRSHVHLPPDPAQSAPLTRSS